MGSLITVKVACLTCVIGRVFFMVDFAIMITLTKRAAKKVRELEESESSSGKLLKISVVKGGCSGYEYRLQFDRKEDADVEVESYNVRILISSNCAAQLEGAEMDFDDGLTGKGFEIHNPNAAATCGCGKSFN